jgi:hypothetical protein
MRVRWILLALFLTAVSALYAYQKQFRQYPGIEYESFDLPADWKQPAEFIFARLMYPQIRGRGRGGVFGAYGDGNWTQGMSMWTQDYPRADRHFLLAIRRLTRIEARSVEQPVNLDDGDDVYNFPWLYAVQPGRWNLTDKQAAKLRDYLDRGGFFMADDFWGEDGWEVFMASMGRVIPDRQPIDLPDDERAFHTVYDLSDRYQVPGARYRQTGVTEKCQGCPAQWRGIYDDKGRLVVALTPNSDLGDSWEWADDPTYLEKFSALGIRIGVNYIVYAMTH